MMPNWELKFWEAKWAKEPPPQDRLEWMIANLTALTANVNRGKGKKVKKPEQFMMFRKAFQAKLSDDKDIDSDIHTIIEGLGEGAVKIQPKMQRQESDTLESIDEPTFGDLQIDEGDYL